MIGFVAASALAQSVPQAVRPISPWDGMVQVLACAVVDEDQEAVEYVLTLTDTDAFIVGQWPGQKIRMEKFESFETEPTIVRGHTQMRRLRFSAADAKILVRQLYQANSLRSTFVAIVYDATDERNSGFEKAAGFCRSNSTETKQ